jgi:hypothetical protein
MEAFVTIGGSRGCWELSQVKPGDHAAQPSPKASGWVRCQSRMRINPISFGGFGSKTLSKLLPTQASNLRQTPLQSIGSWTIGRLGVHLVVDLVHLLRVWPAELLVADEKRLSVKRKR